MRRRSRTTRQAIASGFCGTIVVLWAVFAEIAFPAYAEAPALSRAADSGAVHRVQIVDANQDAAKVLFAQGFTFYKQANYQDAESKFSEGLKLDPGNAEAHYYLAQVLQQDNDYQQHFSEVALHYLKAVELAPATKTAVLAKLALSTMEKALPETRRSLDGKWCYDEALTTQVHADVRANLPVDAVELLFNERDWPIGLLRWAGTSRSETKIDYIASVYPNDYEVWAQDGENKLSEISLIDQTGDIIFDDDRPLIPPKLEIWWSIGDSELPAVRYFKRC